MFAPQFVNVRRGEGRIEFRGNFRQALHGHMGSTLEEPRYCVFVDGVPYNWEVEKIRQLFGRCGPVVEVRAPTWQDSGRLRGYAHVDYSTPEGRDEAREDGGGGSSTVGLRGFGDLRGLYTRGSRLRVAPSTRPGVACRCCGGNCGRRDEHPPCARRWQLVLAAQSRTWHRRLHMPLPANDRRQLLAWFQSPAVGEPVSSAAVARCSSVAVRASSGLAPEARRGLRPCRQQDDGYERGLADLRAGCSYGYKVIAEQVNQGGEVLIVSKHCRHRSLFASLVGVRVRASRRCLEAA